MSKFNIFETNDALGYKELAFLLETPDGYLCIGLQHIQNGESGYTIGEIVNVDFVSPTAFKIEDSPLYKTYLFKQFLNTL